MTIEDIVVSVRIAKTGRAWGEIRKQLTALVAQARDEEAEACMSAVCNALAEADDITVAGEAIRARIAARAEGGK